MLEQKLFFTRNGEYTVWEKICSLSDENLNIIINFIKTKMNRAIQHIDENSYKKRIIYTTYLECNEDKILYKMISERFSVENIERCDFNGTLFKIDLNYTNIDLAYVQLQELSNMNDEYGIDNINTYVFLKKSEDCIDIRLSSYKLNEYKENSNKQIINTEIRIYFKLGLLLMTDYGDYTHSKKVKEKLLENIYNLFNNAYQSKASYKLSDIALRYLLKKSDKYGSKFKFYVDDYMNADFNIIDDIGDNPLQHSELREFYDKHPIAGIKIAMNSNDEKYITIDGERGKLISRSKNMEVKDIDEFIKLLDDVIKYDYLNFDYRKNLKEIAIAKLTGHTATKVSQVDDIYNEVESKVDLYLDGKNDKDTILITKNTFFYCILNKRVLLSDNEETYKLDNGMIGQISKLVELKKEDINSTFNYLIELAVSNKDNLLEVFDEAVKLKGDLNVNQI